MTKAGKPLALSVKLIEMKGPMKKGFLGGGFALL